MSVLFCAVWQLDRLVISWLGVRFPVLWWKHFFIFLNFLPQIKKCRIVASLIVEIVWWWHRLCSWWTNTQNSILRYTNLNPQIHKTWQFVPLFNVKKWSMLCAHINHFAHKLINTMNWEVMTLCFFCYILCDANYWSVLVFFFCSVSFAVFRFNKLKRPFLFMHVKISKAGLSLIW